MTDGSLSKPHVLHPEAGFARVGVVDRRLGRVSLDRRSFRRQLGIGQMANICGAQRPDATRLLAPEQRSFV